MRETKEETNLDVRVLQLVDVFTRLPNIGFGPHTAIAVAYLCEVVGGRLELSHEHTEARYWEIDKVPAWHEFAVWLGGRVDRGRYPAGRTDSVSGDGRLSASPHPCLDRRTQ